ncbi:vanadium nitrogenase [Candidatus Methylospira mobilis]|uniref:Vanadium nitrogenase n=1 Tax=Candidatus Methylospira mobilis TaxID=1808979 RepID=A0A5Q0BH65_9GAMM|nr:NifB/NifX family molybdenum-iron cluster-binding protein [Candidatus Methylospira mobilis]QFY41517.1 vanadium nitrogenase [Candidatus Methylospira mobilis]WNV05247.1 NifB/NifX family molybdenum-iron cluster-binding protein [Candidatus Methylospira mobilis]
MIKIAFASKDQAHVNLHFGAAESFIIYEVAPGRAELVAVGEFIPVEMKGDLKNMGLEEEPEASQEPPQDNWIAAHGEELVKPKEDKVAVKLEFLAGCAGVYAASIGSSSIRRLMNAGIQPIIVENGRAIEDLLNDISLALGKGGTAWIDRALAKARAGDRFEAMARQA